jgi:hypothetical protein
MLGLTGSADALSGNVVAPQGSFEHALEAHNIPFDSIIPSAMA